MSHTTHVPRVSINDTIDVDHVTLSADADPNSSLPTFQSRSLWVPIGARGAFGGQTIAQALVAAGRTVSPLMGLHSQSTYFLWPAAGHLRVTYEVETLRDGKNFASRLVRARQEGKICIIVTCSFTTSDGQSGTSKGQGPPFGFLTTPTAPPPPSSGKAEGKSKGKQSYVSRSLQFAVGSSQHQSATESKFAGRPFAVRTPPFRPRVQIPFPRHVVPYEQSEPEEQRWARWLSRKGITWDHPSRTVVEEYIQERRGSPITIAIARLHHNEKETDGQLGHDRWAAWFCARMQPGDRRDPEFAKAIIAYMTDFQFIGVTARSLGLTRSSTPKLSMLASLDHNIHFYPLPADFNIADPLLYVVDCPVSDIAASRGLARGLLYTHKGQLVAVTHQEGVVRAEINGKKESGLVEQGVVAGDEQPGKKGKGPRAKL